MQKAVVVLACAAVLFLLGAMAFLAPADARRGGGVRGGGHFAGHAAGGRVYRGRNVRRNVNRTRNVNVNRRYVYRNGRRGYWRNGVWVVVPAVAGATYVASCTYEYGRWQATGSTYWRDRYYRCAN